MGFVNDYFDELNDLVHKTQASFGNNKEIELADGYDRAASLFKTTKDTNNKIMVIGNGGSAAIACHMQTDLSSLSIRSITFYDPSLLTALSNDFGYNQAFKRCIDLWAEPNDLLIGISSSGQSENILGSVQTAQQKGSRVITFSGFQEDNHLRSLGDLNFYIASSHYGYVETAHAILAHSLADYYKSKYLIN